MLQQFFDEVRSFWEWIIGLYAGLPWGAMPLFLVALVIVLSSLVSLLILIVRAQATIRWTEHSLLRRRTHEDEYLWVFFVPALNEEVTIADSVGRLREVEVTHKRILVIDDGSDDRTAEILSEMDRTNLTVLTRSLPEARQGKTEALNEAWRHLVGELVTSGEYAGWDPRKVIVGIIDADGRLDRKAGRIARYFSDEHVGGVQSLVRIYNTRGFLTWAQNIEFAVFGHVFQMARTGWGTANMGGNGQFNRLQALNEVAVAGSSGKRGPWREGRLTEDQDIGLRLIHAGWQGQQSTRVTIDQQGLNSVRALYRQRTRWAQGGWQMLDLVRPLARNTSVGAVARWDQIWYLVMPILQSFVIANMMLSVSLLATGAVSMEWTVPVFALIYVFSVLPGVLGVLFARRRLSLWSMASDVVLAHGYVIYSWFIFPSVYRALWLHMRGAQAWAKTRREVLDDRRT